MNPKSMTPSEREQKIVDFVTSLWRQGEHDTQPDRERWATNLDLFAGKTPPSDRQEWQSQPFLHILAPLVRRAADASSDIIFDKEDFIEFESWDDKDQGAVKLAQVFSKVLKHYNDRAKIQSLFYDFLVALGTCGLGILKVHPEQRVVWTADVILEKIGKQQKKFKKGLAGKVENDWETIPEDDADLTKLLDEELENLLGTGQVQRKLGPKKKVELFITTRIVNPLNFVWSPDCDSVADSPYKIERHYSKLHDLDPYFKSGFFRKNKRHQIQMSSSQAVGANVGVNMNSSFEGQKINLRDQLNTPTAFSRTITLLEYYGDFWDEHGNILEENKHFIIAADKVLLRDSDIEDFDQGDPYIVVVASPRPFKAVGAGVADNAVDQQIITNDLFATFLDMFKLAIYPPRAYDSTAFQDADELEEDGLYPGQLIRAYKPASEAFTDITSSGANVAPILFQTLELMNLTAEKGAGIDTQSANPASRTRISAKEIQSNTSRSGQSQNSFARNIDENLLEPYARSICDIILQYGLELDNLKDLAQTAVITQEEFELLKNIPPIERYLEAKKKLKIKIRGFRERIERVQRLGNSADFLGMLTQFPPEAIQKMNFTTILKDVVDLFGFDGDSWIYQNTPADKAGEENMLLLNDQMVGIGEQDQHEAELPAHYAAVLKGPTQALLAHIQMHIQTVLEQGGQPPKMPPEVMEALGVSNEQPPTPAPTTRRITARRTADGGLEGEVNEG